MEFVNLLDGLESRFGNLVCCQRQVHLFEAWQQLLVAEYGEGETRHRAAAQLASFKHRD